jgi:hypothetical protein
LYLLVRAKEKICNSDWYLDKMPPTHAAVRRKTHLTWALLVKPKLASARCANNTPTAPANSLA